MFIDPNWRVFTVGDGDLTFSTSLHKLYTSIDLEASIYDSESELEAKYTEHALGQLRNSEVPVHTSFDITDAQTVSQIEKRFDVVIFQFPLIKPIGSNWDPEYNTNLLNRRLLRYFLIHSFRYLLCDQGPQLYYITSKDVFPYNEWNIEHSINHGVNIPYLGSIPFKPDQFPGYRIRNVSRDATVADTKSKTYIWGHNPSTDLLSKLNKPAEPSNYCTTCKAGPFVAEEDKTKHFQSAQHQTKQLNEEKWQRMISEMGKNS